MIDALRLREILAEYKKDFVSGHWDEERYKWEAVKHFQDAWDVNAPDFAEMLKRALGKTSNLLASYGNFPLAMIERFAKIAPEETRAMFVKLFDEGEDCCERIEAFKSAAATLLEKYGEGAANHYQNENSITTYLWLRYPDKYYIYKFAEARKVAAELDSSRRFKKGAYADNVRNHLALYDELCDELQRDEELVGLLKTNLTPECYPDSRLRTLASDVGFYISRRNSVECGEEHDDALLSAKEQNPDPVLSGADLEPYGKERFLEEVFIGEKDFDRLVRTLAKKKNLILHGAPGTGKTFAAKRLAYALMGSVDDSRIEFVQFHQSYSYEDFVMGYRPDGDGFHLSTGIFYDFCKKAESRPGKPFFFIIDEINRGNMSKVLGELLMLIEADHRGDKVVLAYSGLPFSVPDNLYLIGMMNTADRSLAMIDYALRRRFAFYEMQPAFDSDGFRKEMDALGSSRLEALIGEIRELNAAIEADGSLGRGFRIGHSYFCGLEDGSADELSAIVDLEIIPMLEEYWFDNDAETDKWRIRLESAIG